MPEGFLILILIGAIAGVLSGMFGIGGGAIIVPALILFLDFTQKAATGTSLGALLLPVGIFACIEYYRQDKLKILPAAMVALGLTVMSWVGATLAISLPDDQLQTGYGVLLIVMAWRYIAPRKWAKELRGEAVPAPPERDVDYRSPRVLGLALGVGLIAGVASGLFGIGGGVVIVPALMIIGGFDQKLATGTSLGALLLPVGLPAVWAFAQPTAEAPAGYVSIATAAPIAIMLMLGAIIGARITLGLPTKTVKRLYGFFLLFVGLRFLLG